MNTEQFKRKKETSGILNPQPSNPSLFPSQIKMPLSRAAFLFG